MFRASRWLPHVILGLVAIGSNVPAAFAQSSIESRLETIENQLDRVEPKLDRVLAGQQMSVLSASEELILDQACDGSLLDKEFFVVCRVPDWNIARWVGCHLSADNPQGNAKRTDDFRPDIELPHDERSKFSDYSGRGYDRGHMAPAAAFKRSKNAMSTTFLLSNVVPQTLWLQPEQQGINPHQAKLLMRFNINLVAWRQPRGASAILHHPCDTTWT